MGLLYFGCIFRSSFSSFFFFFFFFFFEVVYIFHYEMKIGSVVYMESHEIECIKGYAAPFVFNSFFGVEIFY